MIPNDAMLWRMIWKEYRAQRGFWLAIAGFAVVLMLTMIGLVDDQSDRRQFTWTVAISLPAIYALGCAAVMFASESEDGTTDFLRIMAARTSRVFLGKVSFSLVSTLAMSAVLLATAWILTRGIPSRPNVYQAEVADPLLATAVLIVQFLAWGYFFSSVCRKALTAVCLTAVTPLVSAAIFSELLVNKPSVRFWNAGLAMVIPLVAAAYILTRRALAGPARDWSLPRLKWRRTRATGQLQRLAAIRETAPAWRRMFRRLVWIELRQALSVGHVLWIAGLAIFVWFPMGANAYKPDAARGIFGILLSSLLIGVWTFQSEGGRRTGFLADHGLSPQIVWLCKQFAWGMLTLAVTAPFLLAVGVANHMHVQHYHDTISSVFHSNVPGASATTFALTLICLGYAAGQFASMLIRRAVTAGFVGLVLLGLLGPWGWLMIALRIPLAISVVPLVVILLAATLGWSRHWLLEQATARSWGGLGLMTGGSLVLLWAGIGAFRVYEVPRPAFVDEIAAVREAHGLSIAPEAAATATLYRGALAHLKLETRGAEDLPSAGQQSSVHGWEHASEFQRRMLAENQDSLRQCLAATGQPNCAFNDPTHPISEQMEQRINASLQNMPQLATLILLSARELEARGQLDEALDRYVAVLRLARHAASHGTIQQWAVGMRMESQVSTWVPVWAAHSEQTPERIEAGARRIGQEAAQFPTLRDAVLTQQFMIHRALRDDWIRVALPPDAVDEAKVRTMFTVFDRLFPWERARSLRVLDLVDAAQLHCLDVLDQSLASAGIDMQQWAEVAGVATTGAVPERSYAAVAAINRQNRGVSAIAGGPDDFFAIQQSSAAQQERVPWNWLKTTFPLNMTFGQHDLSRIWNLRMQRELWVRTMLLRLKLAAFKKRRGEYPERVDIEEFKGDAIDPYTGTEFGYRRQGFPFPIRVVTGLTYTEENLNAGHPFFWSAGPGNVRLFIPTAVGNELPDQSTGAPVQPTVSRNAMKSALVFALP